MNKLVAEIRAEQRAEWLAGRRVPIERFLDRHPALKDDDEAIVDAIYGEICLHEELREPVNLEDYLQRFSKYAEQLRRQLLFDRLVDPPATVPEVSSNAIVQETVQIEHPSSHSFPTVPGYEIQSVLGEGTHGIVYLARQLSLDKLVALKMLRDGDLARQEYRKLLRRDAEVLAKLKHPNIVRIIDFGEAGGRLFYTMEYVKGRSLEERLKAGPLPPREAADLVAKLARALQTVHEKGIVHRDLKPANILLDENGTPEVADFGLAKLLGGHESLAASGQLVGNVAHMAPEQTGGKTSDVGPGADIWALGIILYESLSGRLPFVGKSFLDTLGLIRTGEPAPLQQFDVDRDLQAICFKCLEKKTWQRYATTAELADELGRFLNQDPRDPVLTRIRSWPIRTWRLARRRPIDATALVLIILVLPAIPLIQLWMDPERPVAQLESRLASGHTVTLIGEEGRPAWFRLRAGADTTQVSQTPDGAWSINSWGFCLVELMRKVRLPGYRFRAWIRHEKGKRLSEVGLFFGLEEIATKDGMVLSFGHVAFDDVNSEAELNLLRPPGFPGPVPEPMGNPIYIMPFIYSLRADSSERAQALNSGSPSLRFKPFITQSDWRLLTIEVHSDRIIAYWGDNEKIGIITMDEWSEFLLKGLSADRLVNRTKVPAFNRGGAIGLYVAQGTASFRQVVVEPLDGEAKSW
jgi:serine/threonine-protein kinase